MRSVSTNLFTLSGSKDFSEVHSVFGRKIGVLPKITMQEVGIVVMKEYGLEEAVFERRGEDRKHPNGLSTNVLEFPSQTRKGLSFVRELDYIAVTEEPVAVAWSAQFDRALYMQRAIPLKIAAADSKAVS